MAMNHPNADRRGKGGMCVASNEACTEGKVAAQPTGCTGGTPVCCEPDVCKGPGELYYPTVGICCPGLRALDSSVPMESFIAEVEGLLCFANCWSYTYAPCGDGACEPHLGETPCTCPEDCPFPPVPFVCEDSGTYCGRAFCRQDGPICYQEAPSCLEHLCEWVAEDHPGQTCDRQAASCSP